MPTVIVTSEIVKRIQILEAQYKTQADFAKAMGVEGSTVRHWKNQSHKMSLTAFILFQLLEKEKLTINHQPGCNCSF